MHEEPMDGSGSEGLGRDFVFSDYLMFDRVMQDEGICAAFLETVLGIEVESIEYLQVEHCAIPQIGTKKVRMDVYVKDRLRAYDVEMQAYREPYLGRRLRYYQGSMDLAELKEGQTHKDLMDSYIVVLCTYDPLGEGLPVYTIHPACNESPGADLSTGQCWVVLNAHAWRDAPTEGLRNLLEYVSKRKVPAGSPDPLVARIDAEVERANRDAEWRAEAMGFMTLEQHYRAREQYAEEQGIEQGQAIGEARYGRLVEALLAESRLEDLRKASEDAGYRHGLYEELGI